MKAKAYCLSDGCVLRANQKIGTRVLKIKDRIKDDWQCRDCSSALRFVRDNDCEICGEELKNGKCRECGDV